MGTASFHVVRSDCQVSLVSISKFANGSAIFDTATGVFAANETFYKLSVNMPCNIDSETDLVLGPPALYPPGDLDLGARVFNIACPSGGGGSSSGGGGGSGANPDSAPSAPASAGRGTTRLVDVDHGLEDDGSDGRSGHRRCDGEEQGQGGSRRRPRADHAVDQRDPEGRGDREARSRLLGHSADRL